MIGVSPPRTVSVQLDGHWVDGAVLNAWRYNPDGWFGRVRYRAIDNSEIIDWLPADEIRTDPHAATGPPEPAANARHRRD